MIDKRNPLSGDLRTTFRFSLLFTVAVSLGERVSGKGADLYEMCDELDALLTGNITATWPVYTCTYMYYTQYMYVCVLDTCIISIMCLQLAPIKLDVFDL